MAKDTCTCTCTIYYPLRCDCWCHKPGEARGSRPGVDPIFYDAAFREFMPDEKDMIAEKVELPHLLRSKGAI